MTEEKTQGIVLKLIDYKDANKLASIFTLHGGIITAKFNGVKKEKAKLKAVAQPFVFADLSINQIGLHKTVIGAQIIDNFYQILADYNKTVCGYVVLDLIKSILPENQPEQDLFLITIAALKNIETRNEYVSTVDFMLKFLNFSGVGVELFEVDHVFLDKITGDFTTTRTMNSIEIDKKVYGVLKDISKNPESMLNIDLTNIETLPNFSESTIKQALRLLGNIVYLRFNVEIKSLHFI